MLTERMQILVRAHPAGMVATVNEDGTPAVSPKGTFVVLSPESLAFGNIRSPGTIRNLWRRPDIEVCFLDVLERLAVRVRGVATVKRRADCSLDLLSEFETAWPEYLSRMEDIVMIAVGSAQLIRSPAYDIGYAAADLRKAYLERLRKLSRSADDSGSSD